MNFIGGSGVVRAKNKIKAVEIINKQLKDLKEPVKETDLIRFPMSADVQLITNGDC